MTFAEIRNKYRVALSAMYGEREARAISSLVFEKVLVLQAHQLAFENFRILTAHQQSELENILQRLLSHEPVQYILGEAHFYGLHLKVNHAVLIPRPETEELVAWMCEEIPLVPPPVRLLDIGTGSGCIPISLSKKFPNAKIDATDVSAAALAIAKENNDMHKTSVAFTLHNILTQQLTSNTYHLIVSNPPYIPTSEKTDMAANVLQFEPHLALFTPDDDPLIFYRAIAQQAVHALLPGGKLFFEINASKAKAVTQLLLQLNYRNIEVRKDLSGKDRMVKAEK